MIPEQRKTEDFINWICGDKVPFPFFKDTPIVKYPNLTKRKINKDGSVESHLKEK